MLFERHAVGGEYGAGWKEVGKGRLVTTFFPDAEGGDVVVVDARVLGDDRNVAVVYHNPLDNVEALAHHFFSRTLAAGVTPSRAARGPGAAAAPPPGVVAPPPQGGVVAPPPRGESSRHRRGGSRRATAAGVVAAPRGAGSAAAR